jgi:hypothetical protein
MRVLLALGLLALSFIARAETPLGRPVPVGDAVVTFSPAFASPMLGTLGGGADGLIATVERSGEADVTLIVAVRLVSGAVETLEGSARITGKGYVWLPASARPDTILAVTLKVTVTYKTGGL